MSNLVYPANIGDRVRQMRLGRNWSYSVAADKIGISISYLQIVERGKANVAYDKIVAICRAFNCPIANLVDDSYPIWGIEVQNEDS